MKALIVIDVQNDFMPGGPLGVPEGHLIIPVINNLFSKLPNDFIVIFTQDWHPQGHCSFKEQGGVWPEHCVQCTHGAELHSDIIPPRNSLFIRKGTDIGVDSYSAFFDNERKKQTELHENLQKLNIEELHICGLATDYCVKFSVLDALSLGYKVHLIQDACRGVEVNKGDTKSSLEDMAQAGSSIKSSIQLIS